MRTFLLTLCLACVSFAQTRIIGAVTAKTQDQITVKPDSGETVTLNVALKNSGGAPTTNLIATLLTSGGIAAKVKGLLGGDKDKKQAA